MSAFSVNSSIVVVNPGTLLFNINFCSGVKSSKKSFIISKFKFAIVLILPSIGSVKVISCNAFCTST